MRLEQLESFKDWYDTLSMKLRKQIDARLSRVQNHEHFGDSKDLGDGVGELRWKNGTRVYYALIEDGDKVMLLILGGNKNGQDKDISKAKSLLKKYSP